MVFLFDNKLISVIYIEKQMKEYFNNFNGGKGLDHWSPSSSQNFTRLLINYSLPQELRRSFLIRYKAPFGNLVNNTTQRMLCEILYEGDKKIKLENKNYDEVFQYELDDINKNTTAVDDKDNLARDMMIEFAHPTIKQMMNAVKEIFGNEKLVSERYVSSKSKDMIHDIIGRIDYESKYIIGEAKTKPPSIKKKRGKDEYYMATTQLPKIQTQCTFLKLLSTFIAQRKNLFCFMLMKMNTKYLMIHMNYSNQII